MKRGNNLQQGQAVLIVVIFFLIISLTIIFGVTTPILNHVRASKDLLASKEVYYVGEAGMEDVVYRLRKPLPVSTTETLSLNGHTAQTVTTSTAEGKRVTAEGNAGGYVRKVETSLVIGEGVSFNYGVQVGNGGFEILGGSIVYGNVYSNGNIIGDGGPEITGSAIAASRGSLTPDQVNDSPLPSPSSITFRRASANQDFAQSFQPAVTGPISKISFYIRKVGSPADASVRIVNNSGGSPGTTNLLTTSGTLQASQITSSYGWIDVTLPSNPVLTAGTTYWVVIDSGTQHNNNYYVIGANTAYTSGQAKLGQFGGSWSDTSPSGLDGYFKVFAGIGSTGLITGDGTDYLKIGTQGGDAWAHTINSVNTPGVLYCQNGSTNAGGKTCDTSRPDPTEQDYPVSDANIAAWKADAEAGGVISGNYSVGWAGATLGPKKITGNLSISGGGTLTVSGTIWVEGTITVSGGGKMVLAPSYGSASGVIISDKYVSLSGGGEFAGSGQAGSYPLVLVTSDCPASSFCSGNNAVTLNGGAGAVVLNAQKGTLTLSGGTAARSLVANKIILDGGATVVYESGVANMNFTSGPSGGWNIVSWREIE